MMPIPRYAPLVGIGLLTVAIAILTPFALAGSSTLPLTRPALAQVASSVPNAVQVSGGDGQFFGQVLVTATPETAWAVLTDYNNFATIFPNVETSRVLSSSGNQTVFEQVSVVRVAAIARRNRVVVSALRQPPRQINFRAIDGDVESLEGVWQILPRSANQVLITHQVTVEPKSSSLRGLFFNVYRHELRNTLVALKREIERRGQ